MQEKVAVRGKDRGRRRGCAGELGGGVEEQHPAGWHGGAAAEGTFPKVGFASHLT